MICQRCLLGASRRSQPRISVRAFASTPQLASTLINRNVAETAAPRTGDASSRQPPVATSTAAAQPFSTPLTPSPAAEGVLAKKPVKKSSTIVMSSVAAGVPLRGLNFEKGKLDPLAMEDSEYPDWLWTLLDKKKKAKGVFEGAEADLYSKSNKQRREAAKKLRKQQLKNPELLAPKVPVYEQTIDLPAGDGSVEGAILAGEVRDGLTKGMRVKRRGDIKEKNYLKAMG
ncbi:mitochondrial ribosomal protein L37-domain-containing protein [Lineolata rhizophorae]|uniref:Large ribosomal subunit protein mL54 n=1 Tax=Lineolata rhizophorae TaxID=578093 RepID=A0A6A6P7W0_9PEZI|nr:mitochondrial ribosomal protein L37-domain-containing protein [Lineolata rhizophorae]